MDKALADHLQFFNYYFLRKMGFMVEKHHNGLKAYEKIAESQSDEIDSLAQFLNSTDSSGISFFAHVISDSPNELQSRNKEFINFTDGVFGKGSYTKYLKQGKEQRKSDLKIHIYFQYLKKIFKYDEFTNLSPIAPYSAYKLAANLGVRACVYCNRVYTVTHNTKAGGKLMRPTLDHWFPESKYPLLAISFYNLIPSCTHCNSSVKGDKDMNMKRHLHPYLPVEKDDDFQFSYEFVNSFEKYNVLINSNGLGSKHKNTLEFLKIDEMYNSHQDELDDIIKLKKAYSKEYLKKLKESFPGANLSDNEIYRLAFGVEFDKKDFHKRPMSKFKYDILKELGIIKE